MNLHRMGLRVVRLSLLSLRLQPLIFVQLDTSAAITAAAMSSSKLAAIAGCGSGISAAVARRFAAHGYNIALLGLTQEPLDAAAAGGRELQQRYAAVQRDTQNSC